MSQSKHEEVTWSWKRGKTRAIGFALTSDWMKKWREFLNQSCSVANAKPITFRHSIVNHSNWFGFGLTTLNSPLPSPLYLCFFLKSEFKCETTRVKITLICMKMKLHAELIFIWKVSQNRGTRELENGLLKTALVKGNKVIHFAVDDFISVLLSFLCKCQYITAVRITYVIIDCTHYQHSDWPRAPCLF